MTREVVQPTLFKAPGNFRIYPTRFWTLNLLARMKQLIVNTVMLWVIIGRY